MTVPVLTLALVAFAFAGSASAQDASPAVDILFSNPNVRARSRAAGAIGRTRPRGGRQALEAALEDPDAGVRTAVVGALAAYGDAAAVPALLAHGNDHNRRVRDAVTRAVTDLNAHATGVSPHGGGNVMSVDALDAPTPPAPVDWRTVRYVVGIGVVSNQPRDTARFVPVVRASIEQELHGRPGLAPRPAVLPASVAARVHTGAVHTFSLEGGISSLRTVEVPSAAAVRAEVSLLLLSEPSHAIVGTITGAATAQQPVSPGTVPRVDDQLTIHAIQAATRSALAHVEEHLAGVRGR